MTDPLRATLDRLGLGDFYDLLAANDVDACGIDELTEADLRELGLTLGQRKKQFLRARAAPSGLAPPGQRSGAARGLPPAGERRQLTSMFCDLVASTPLSLRLDPEDFSEVIRGFQDTCAGVITSRIGLCRPVSRRWGPRLFRLSLGAPRTTRRARRARRWKSSSTSVSFARPTASR